MKRIISFFWHTIIISLLMAFFAAAAQNDGSKDYRIYDAWWEEKESGNLYARWEKPEDPTTYRVRLYKGSEDRPVGAWRTSSVNGYNFTSDIIKKGTGVYYFVVYPQKADESLVVKSEELEVDREMLKKAKSAGTKTSGSSSATKTVDKVLAELGPGASTPPGIDKWIQLKDGNWVRQKADGSLYKGQWLEVDGKRYLFDTSGYMQKDGWRSVGSIWYYLGSDGAVLKDTTTPDGYTVDNEGQCIYNGQVYRSYLGPYLMSKTTGDARTASLVPHTIITFRTREYPSEAGRPKNMDILTSAGIEIISTSYSKPYENWEAGRSVSITLVIAPASGYYFKKGLKFSPSPELTLISAKGDEQQYTVKFSYLPKVDLATPDGIYITDDGVLHWNKVKNATEYQLTIKGEDLGTERIKTKKNTYDILEYLYYQASLVLTACGNGSSCIKDSVAYRIDDLDSFYENNTVTQKGWYQNPSDGYWYYFDSQLRMKTGKITDNGTEYFLNDGSEPGLPVGAWVEGR